MINGMLISSHYRNEDVIYSEDKTQDRYINGNNTGLENKHHLLSRNGDLTSKNFYRKWLLPDPVNKVKKDKDLKTV